MRQVSSRSAPYTRLIAYSAFDRSRHGVDSIFMVDVAESETARIQRDVGLASFVFAGTIAVVNTVSIAVVAGRGFADALGEPAVWILAVNAVLGLASAYVRRHGMRIVQVLLFLASAAYAAAVSPAGNLTSAALLVYSLLLALQYDLFVRSAVFHYVAFFTVYTAGMVAGLLTGTLTPTGILAKLLATGFLVYLMWIALGRQLHTYRTKAESTSAMNAELERLVRQRTKELEHALAEKTVLVQEIHHRVKNNLGIISSMLALQSDVPGGRDAGEVLEEVQHRIYAMALIHEELYSSDSLSSADLAEYVHTLGATLAESYGMDAGRVLRLNIGEIALPVNTALPCGMVLAECISNSVKYAFPDDRPPSIEVTARRSDGELFLRIADNGVGIPPDVAVDPPDTFGLWLIQTLVTRQLHGRISLDTSGGTAWEAIIPLEHRHAESRPAGS